MSRAKGPAEQGAKSNSFVRSIARKAWEPRYRLILLGLLFFFMACQRQDLNCLVGCFVELSEHTGCGRGTSGCSCVKIEGPPTEAPEYRLSLPAEAAELLNMAAARSCDPDHDDLLARVYRASSATSCPSMTNAPKMV